MTGNTKAHILLAEDDRNISEIMKLVLQEEGYEVAVAGTKDDVFKFCEVTLPDLIFLDVRLQGENGEEIARELRTRETTSSIPFIILSADNEIRTISARVGANDFLQKPFELQHLIDLTKKHLKK